MQIKAIKAQAEQKIKAEKASWLPTVYAFGQYDFKQEDALITDSDWAFGVGFSYQLLSNKNRSRQIKSASLQAEQADYSLQDNRVKLGIAVERAWLAADSARQDRKSTRLNSSHVRISYAVFCLKKKKKKYNTKQEN